MRCGILAIGSRGDIELFLTLGRTLRARGHEVRFAVAGFYREAVASAGLEWISAGNGTAEEFAAVLRSLSSCIDPIRRTHVYFRKWVRPRLEESRETASQLARWSDLVVSNVKIFPGAAEADVPEAWVTYDLPHSLEELKTPEDPTRVLELAALNRRLVDPLRLWNERYQFTGFWRKQRKNENRVEPSLLEFMDQDEPPIVVAMGSMGNLCSKSTWERCIAAIRATGRHAVVVSAGAAEVHCFPATTDLMVVESAPYGWLFERAAAVIHHGGVGTTTACLAAGRPSILLPQIACQLQLARVLQREKLATVCGGMELNVASISKAIDDLIHSDGVRKACDAWQSVVLAEPGVDASARWMEQFVRGESLERYDVQVAIEPPTLPASSP